MLIPTFDFGAKRPVLDHGYLQSLHDPRVKLISTPSLSVVAPRELQSNNGDIFPADVLILANGFETQQLLTPMKITGLRGAELPALWQQSEKYASAYMGYVKHSKGPSLQRHADPPAESVSQDFLTFFCSPVLIPFLPVTLH
jgi:cation diffusion facilitator CzcD-associated flavoprotein CzcO